MSVQKNEIEFEIQFFEKLVSENPNFVDALIPLAEAYTRKGLHKKGLAIDKRLVRLRKDDPYVYYNLACSYALLGEKDKAINSLSRSVRLGYDDVHHMKKDQDLRILHDDPRFKRLVDILNF